MPMRSSTSPSEWLVSPLPQPSVAELYGFHAPSEDNELFADGGVTLGISEDFQIDLRLAAKIDRNGSERHVGIGIARRWRIFP